MDFIAYLIERELLARRAISLPFIGILSRERMSARFSSNRSHLTAPHDVLTLTADADQAGEEFIKLIAAETGTSSSEAIATYNEWYASSIDEEGTVLTIDSVCSINLVGYSIIAIDGAFEGYLSPLGDEPISICGPIENRGYQASNALESSPEGATQAEQRIEVVVDVPRSAILESLPIIEDVTYEIFETVETVEFTTPAHTINAPQARPEQRQVRPVHTHRPARPAQQRRAVGQSSSMAVILSIIIAAGAALYIGYYFACKHGIL